MITKTQDTQQLYAATLRSNSTQACNFLIFKYLPYYTVCTETTNCWKAAYKLGTCNTPPSGPQSGIDATDVIEGFLNSIAQEGCPIPMSENDIFVNNPQSGFFINFINRGSHYPFNYPTPVFPKTGYRDYYLFRTSAGTSYGYNDCLSISDINFYRDGAIHIMRQIFAANPSWSGQYVAYCDMSHTVVPSGTLNVIHVLSFTTATFVQ